MASIDSQGNFVPSLVCIVWLRIILRQRVRLLR
jgi:hypothetical protein